uniref:Transmembrane protein n=1 Tax=Steinernema glaseri TaxID=37863 RepID=A0A1I7ZGU1_9BILA
MRLSEAPKLSSRRLESLRSKLIRLSSINVCFVSPSRFAARVTFTERWPQLGDQAAFPAQVVIPTSSSTFFGHRGTHRRSTRSYLPGSKKAIRVPSVEPSFSTLATLLGWPCTRRYTWDFYVLSVIFWTVFAVGIPWMIWMIFFYQPYETQGAPE